MDTFVTVYTGIVLPVLLLRAVLPACDTPRCPMSTPLAVRPTVDTREHVLRAARPLRLVARPIEPYQLVVGLRDLR